MTNVKLKFLAATVFFPFTLGVRADFSNNIPVKEIHEGDRIDEANHRVEIPPTGDGFVDYFACDVKLGRDLTFTDDRKFAACCLHGQKLLGSPQTAFDCCASGHALAGKNETGYHCCPTGQDYDGSKCTNPNPVCHNGQVLVDGKCACPKGTTEVADGTCKKTGCDSGIITGKCYQFKMEDGHLLGYYGTPPGGYYAAMVTTEAPRKFKFYKDQACKPGDNVNPGDAVHILDAHVQQWLNDATNGKHIGVTPDYDKAGIFGKAGNFSITKWTCGKYCIAGIDQGVRLACPSTEPSWTFDTQDKQRCLPLDIIEVPCDIRAAENNCFWEKKPGACGPGDVTSCQCPSHV